MKCPHCGREAHGKYCSSCGTPLGVREARCSSCGTVLEAGALYCSQCGAPSGRRSQKPAVAYLPWILSALALIAFAVAITLFIRGQALERTGDMPVTGGVIAPETSGESGSAAGMPSAAELAAMPPREAADRLFDRAMRMDEAGEAERAQFFADMAVQAYGALPPDELDLDARFHLGLLNLVRDDPDAARAEADAILEAHPRHLLGLSLLARIAGVRGDKAARREAYEQLLEALSTELASDRPEYRMHESMIQADAQKAREITGPS